MGAVGEATRSVRTGLATLPFLRLARRLGKVVSAALPRGNDLWRERLCVPVLARGPGGPGRLALLICVVLLGLGPVATPGRAQPFAWSATPASGDWNNGGNWIGGIAPNSLTAVRFPAAPNV